MESQEQPPARGRGRKRTRRSPRTHSDMASGSTNLGTQTNPQPQAPGRKRVQQSPASRGGMTSNVPPSRGFATSDPRQQNWWQRDGITSNVPTSRGFATTRPRRQNGSSNAKGRKNYEWLTEGTERVLKTFPSNRLRTESTFVTSEKGFELLCTYNWRDSKEPSIYVPGKSTQRSLDAPALILSGAPPSFISKQCPITLPKDTGLQYIDQNAYRVPHYPFEPIFKSLSIMNPQASFSSVDLVTNRNSLRKLLDFADGKVKDPFRIDLSVIGNTLFLSRHERRTTEKLNGYTCAGYGHNFEKVFSEPQPGLEDSTGHHRIIKYPLGNLNCVVRYEVDACCDTDSGLPGHNEGENQPRAPVLSAEDSILDKLTKLCLSDGTEAGAPGEQQRIEVIQRGTTVPTTRTAEVKTRSSGLKLNHILPQLWIGRTPHLRVGMHSDGRFRRVEEIKAADKFIEWEETNQIQLLKVVRLLHDLREIVKNDGSCAAVCASTGRLPKLEIYSVKFKSRRETLPRSVVQRFWGGDDGGATMTG
ncbi:hypothetical protein FQN54_006364 [Arachnomyces sp. PD_36]|nr:hypothetical protein FQN54_006364 [Arachnomyces sp. PD_36]